MQLPSEDDRAGLGIPQSYTDIWRTEAPDRQAGKIAHKIHKRAFSSLIETLESKEDRINFATITDRRFIFMLPKALHLNLNSTISPSVSLPEAKMNPSDIAFVLPAVPVIVILDGV